MQQWKTALAATAVFACAGPASAALLVTTTTDASALCNALAGGAGVTITGCSLTGEASQQGTFTGGVSAGIGIGAGVIMTTGAATLAPGPNDSEGTTAALGRPGNALLNALVAPETTEDANVLSVTFRTTTGSLFFNYVFASEEYNEFVNSQFNDVFGFFLNGVNIALIPGTSDPVSINNLNCGTDGTTATSTCSLFRNNDLLAGGPFDLQYDGFTAVLTASATGLLPDTDYTLTLAIADTGDDRLDSAVFLGAQSFQGTPTPPGPIPPGQNGKVPEPGGLGLLGLGLAAMGALRRRRR